MKRRNLLFYSFMFTAGCVINKQADRKSRLSSTSALPNPLNFAVTDAVGIGELQEYYNPFRLALSEVLGTKIEFFPVDNYFTAAVGLRSHQVDLALAGPSEYVVIKARTNATPIIGIKRVDYYTIMVVYRDSGIKSLTDLKGKTIDFLNNGSTSTHLGGIELLMDAGLNPRSDFKSIMSNNNSLTPLITNRADACSRSPHRYQDALQQDGLSPENYPIIAKGKPLPNDVFMVGSHIASNVADKIRNLMLENQTKLLQALGSVEYLATKYKGATLATANDQDYDMIRAVYKAMGQGEFLS